MNGAKIKVPLSADSVVQGQLKKAVTEGSGLFASTVRRKFNCTLSQSKFIMISTYNSETYTVYYTKDIVDVVVNNQDGLKQNSFELQMLSFELQMLSSKIELHAESEKALKMWLRAFSSIFELRIREKLKLKTEEDIERYLERHQTNNTTMLNESRRSEFQTLPKFLG